jgi:cytochrome b561
MRMLDTPQGWGSVSIALHWLTALLVLFAVLIGLSMEDERQALAGGGGLFVLHASLGVLVLAIAGGRVLWRLLNPLPLPVAAVAPWQLWATRAVHLGVLALLGALPLSGWLTLAADGHTVTVLGGLLQLPTLPRDHLLHEVGESLHEGALNVLYVLVGLHVLAALKHHVLDGDATLRRMLRPARG